MGDDSVDIHEHEASGEQEQEKHSSRRQERSLIFHLLYVMDSWSYEEPLERVIENFNAGYDCSIAPDGEIAHMVQAIVAQRDQLDETVKPLLAHWRLERLGVCTRLILRMATWELLNTDTPLQIVINEAVELAKCFAEKGAYKFINGVLDELMKRKAQPPLTP